MTHPNIRRATDRARSVLWPAALATAWAFSLSGCGGSALHKATPTSMDAATSAVEAADDSHVADFAPEEMRAAHVKLLAARQAMGRNELIQAQWYADEAVVNANIALSRATKAKARAALIAAGISPSAP
jgi:hypothetical protein